MNKKDVRPGDIALVPSGAGKFAVGKVLYLSQCYKNVMLFGIYSKAVTERTMPPKLGDAIGLLVYTSQTAIRQHRWIPVGHEPLRENQQGLAKRIVGGEVWDEDKELRPATREDMQTLPRMQVLGAGLVEKKAQQLIAKEGS